MTCAAKGRLLRGTCMKLSSKGAGPMPVAVGMARSLNQRLVVLRAVQAAQEADQTYVEPYASVRARAFAMLAAADPVRDNRALACVFLPEDTITSMHDEVGPLLAYNRDALACPHVAGCLPRIPPRGRDAFIGKSRSGQPNAAAVEDMPLLLPGPHAA